MSGDLRWSYVAEAPDGKVVRGVTFAPDQMTAARLVKAERLTPVEVKADSGKPGILAKSLFSASKSLAERDLAEFCRSFADLLNAGVPAGRSLSLLSSQPGNKKLVGFIAQLSERVRAGEALSSALESAEQKPPRLIIAITAAGESTGKLGEQYAMLAEHYEAQYKLRRELTAQMIYPGALLALIILTLGFLSHFVLPQFESIFSNADALPPPETRIVMEAGAWIREKAALFPLFMLIALLGGRFLLLHFRGPIERIVFKMPIVGAHWRKMIAGRFCRSLGALLVGGASMSGALGIARQTVNSDHLQKKYENAIADIRSGVSFAAAMEPRNLFPETIIGFARLGEETGNLGPMLIKAADRCEQDVKASLTKLTSLIGPIMTAVMGLLTAGVIAAVMSGVLSLNETVY